MQTIIVTARGRGETVQDAPAPISAVSARTLSGQHLDRVADYGEKLPNFAAIQQNMRVSGLYVRGMGGNANNDGVEPGVGLIVDNVYFAHAAFSWLDFVDLDHIELARGPQGTLLGKNTTIGALIVTTAKPSFAQALNLTATRANFDRYQLRANATGPMIADSLAYRVTYSADRSDGWVRNTRDGERYLDDNRWSLRGQLLFSSPGISSRLIVEHYETDEYNNFYVPFADVTSFADGSIRASSWERRLSTIFGYRPAYHAGSTANLDSQARTQTRTQGISNELSTAIGSHSLTAITAWRQLRFRPSNDTDLTPYAILSAGFDLDIDQYSQEVRLASPVGRFDYQLGAYWLHVDLASNNRSKFLKDSTAYFLTGLVPPSAVLPAVLDGVAQSQLGQEHVTSGALFGQATWHASDAVSLTAGVRYTRETKAASNTATVTGGIPLTGGFGALAPARAAVISAFGGTFDLTDTKKTGSWSWLLNPSYRVIDSLRLYASASRGKKSGAANLGAVPGMPVIIGQEESIAYEVGLKSALPGARGSMALNGYWNVIKGYQAPQLDPAKLALGNYLGNVGRVRLRGFELETVVRLARGVTLSGNGAFNDARYLAYKTAPMPVEFQYPGAPPYVDLSGKRLATSAKWTGQISLDVDRPLSTALNFVAYVNQSYRSANNFISPVSRYGRQAGYALTSGGLGIRATDDRWSLMAWGRNLFDKRYFVGIAAPTAVSPVLGIPGDRHRYGVTLTGRFG